MVYDLKMFDCCEVSNVIIVNRKVNFFTDKRYMFDVTVYYVWHVTSIWLGTCRCQATYVVYSLFDFLTRVSLSSLFCAFFSFKCSAII